MLPKKKFKMPNAFTTLFIIIVAVAILTWIIPAGQYKYVDPTASKLQPIAGTYFHTAGNPQGLWDVLYAPLAGFLDATDIMLFLLVIGGYLEIMKRTGAIDAGIGAIVRKLKGRAQLLIPVLMLAFGLGGTTFGMGEETVAFYLMLIPIFIAAGYDALTGMATIFIGCGIGYMASTTNPFSVGIASGFAGVSIGDGLLMRMLLFVLLEGAGIIYIMRYAKKVKADPSQSVIYDMKASNETYFQLKNDAIVPFTRTRKIALSIFALSFLIMIIGIIPWASKFNVHIFENFNSRLLSIPILGKLCGHMVPLGDWWFGEMSLIFFVGTLIVGFVARMGEDEFLSGFVKGAQDLLEVALIIGVSRGITAIMNAGGMTDTVLHWGETYLTGLSPVALVNLAFLFYLPLSFLVPSTSGLATLSMPIMAPLATFTGLSKSLLVTAYATSAGLMNLITPTCGTLMAALLMSRITYDRFWKFSFWLLIELAAITMIVMSVGTFL